MVIAMQVVVGGYTDKRIGSGGDAASGAGLCQQQGIVCLFLSCQFSGSGIASSICKAESGWVYIKASACSKVVAMCFLSWHPVKRSVRKNSSNMGRSICFIMSVNVGIAKVEFFV